MMIRNGRAALVAVLLLACGTLSCDSGKNAQKGIVDPDRSTLAASPGAGIANGLFFVTLTATARDAAGSPLSGRNAVFTVSGSWNVLSVPSTVTDAAGSATVTLTSTRAEAKEVHVTLDGVAVTAHSVVTFLERVPSPQGMAAGPDYSLRVREDGTLWAWGNGPLGDGSTLDRLSPVRIDSGYVAVATGAPAPNVRLRGPGPHSLALKPDGTLWSWGENTHGQLGDGTTEYHLAPAQVGSGFAYVAAGGRHSLAVKADGTLWSWGRNEVGQLGDGTTEDRLSPQEVGSGFIAVAAGPEHSLGLKADGTLLAWGRGPVGDGTGESRSTPVPIGSGFVSASAGAQLRCSAGIPGGCDALSVSLAVKADGTLWAWGTGPLGDGTTEVRLAPVQVGDGFVAVSAGWDHSLGVKADGTLWAWGRNSVGQLGDGTTEARLAPVQVGTGFTAVAAGREHSLGIRADGTQWAWGDDLQGQLGDGKSALVLSPVLVAGGFSVISAGLGGSLAIGVDQSLWAWGVDGGDLFFMGKSVLLPVRVGDDFAEVAAGWPSLAVKSDGTLWEWDPAHPGYPGAHPVQVGSGFATVAADHSHLLALRADGSLWGWGTNDFGQVGDGTREVRPAPVQIGSGYAQVAAGDVHTLAVKTDGTLWSWGGNASGQCGDGTSSDHLVPIQIGDGFASVAAGGNVSLAVKSDGSLWAWGSGLSAESIRSPVQIGSDFVSAATSGSHALGVKTDGTLWAWGDNRYGQLGDGTTDPRPSPVQVGAGFVSVAAGRPWGYSNNWSLALRADGSLWGWGDNTWCQLGFPSFSSIPKQVQFP